MREGFRLFLLAFGVTAPSGPGPPHSRCYYT